MALSCVSVFLHRDSHFVEKKSVFHVTSEAQCECVFYHEYNGIMKTSHFSTAFTHTKPAG